jgi:hypothetical protein
MKHILQSLLPCPLFPSIGKLILYLHQDAVVLAGVLHRIDIPTQPSETDPKKVVILTADTVVDAYPRDYVAGLVGSGIWDLVPSDARALGCCFAYYDKSKLIIYGSLPGANLVGPIHPDLVYKCLGMEIPVEYGRPTHLGFLDDRLPSIDDYLQLPVAAGI